MLRGSAVRLLLLTAFYVLAPVHLKDLNCASEEGLLLLNSIRDNGPKNVETKLYTPNSTQYERCPKSSLECVRTEMKTLLEEWTIDQITSKNIGKVLKVMTQNQNESKNCVQQCETFPEESALNFLHFINNTMQTINAKCSERQGRS